MFFFRPKFQNFEKTEQKLKDSAYPASAPNVQFQESLKRKLLEKRFLAAQSTPVFTPGFWKIFAPAVAAFAVIVLFVIPNFQQKFYEPETVMPVQEEIIQEIQKPEKREEAPKPVERKVQKPVVPVQPVIPQPEPESDEGGMAEEAAAEGEGEADGEPAEFEPAEGFAESGAESAAPASMAPQRLFSTKPRLILNRFVYDIDGESEISQNEIFIVTLFASSSAPITEGTFEVIDILPQGLIFDPNNLPGPPVRIEGQRIIFTISASYFEKFMRGEEKPFGYFVKASAPGTYLFESAVIQSLDNPDFRGFSGQTTIEVK